MNVKRLLRLRKQREKQKQKEGEDKAKQDGVKKEKPLLTFK